MNFEIDKFIQTPNHMTLFDDDDSKSDSYFFLIL
jgi:hypothetical protein